MSHGVPGCLPGYGLHSCPVQFGESLGDGQPVWAVVLLHEAAAQQTVRMSQCVRQRDCLDVSTLESCASIRAGTLD